VPVEPLFLEVLLMLLRRGARQQGKLRGRLGASRSALKSSLWKLRLKRDLENRTPLVNWLASCSTIPCPPSFQVLG
jgi:hypothetical protein